MRIAIIGQQAFGRAALEAFLTRGAEVAGVFVTPERPDARPDPLHAAAIERGLPIFHFANYAAPEALDAIAELHADLGVMAYVTQFVPQSFVRLPTHGMIQFHPSLLPLHRGPSALNWAIMTGRRKTGLTVFRPVDGLDEGPILLQRDVAIEPDDTVGSLYFDKIFPAGIDALLEAADMAVAGAPGAPQDEGRATYEGWVREAESHINWASHVDQVYDLIRGCNPAPGAWTSYRGERLEIFDARKAIARTFGAVRGLVPGQVTAVDGNSFTVHAQGGFIMVQRCRRGTGKKIAAADAGIAAGMVLGA